MAQNSMIFEPLQGLVQGALGAHQIHQQMLQASLAQEREQRQAYQQDRENQIENISIQQKLLNSASPVDAAGMVTEGGMLGKIQGPAGDSRMDRSTSAKLADPALGIPTGEDQSYQFTRKADRSRVVKSPVDGKDYELYDKDRQISDVIDANARKAASEARAAGTKKAAEAAAEEPYKKAAREDTIGGENARNAATIEAENKRNAATIEGQNQREQDNVTEGRLAASVAKGKQPGATATEILKGKAADQALKRMTADKIASRPVTNVYTPTAPPLGADGKPRASTIEDAPAGLRSQIQSVLDYGTKLPASSRLNPTNQAIRQWVTQIDPAYRESDFADKNKIALDFGASGVSGKAITSADTGLSHLSAVSEAGKALKSNDLVVLNKLANFVGAQTGKSAPTVYDSIVETVAPEISKAVIGGTGGVEDRRQMAANFSRNLSDSAREGAIGATAKLLGTRYKKMAEAYQSDMGRPLARKLSAESQAVLDRYSGGGAGGVVYARDPDGNRHQAPAGTALPAGWKAE